MVECLLGELFLRVCLYLVCELGIGEGDGGDVDGFCGAGGRGGGELEEGFHVARYGLPSIGGNGFI